MKYLGKETIWTGYNEVLLFCVDINSPHSFGHWSTGLQLNMSPV